MSANIDIRLLGPLEMAASRVPVVLHGPVQRTLVARLGIRPGETVSREALVDALWGESPPPTATKTLHSHLARLRHQLQDASLAGLIAARGPGYALLAPAEAADVVRFEAMVDRSRDTLAEGATETAVELLRQALGLWRGDPLVECRPGEWVRAETAHLTETRLVATEYLISARLRLGEHVQLVGELEPLVIRYPFREQLWELLMLALYRSGRQADALAAFQRARTALVDELGIEPGRELRQLEAAILAADPTLDLKAPRPTTDAPVCRRLPVPLTSLIDHEADKAALGQLIAGRRLLTLIGPGGCGKTRLAIAVAAEHPDAVCFVDLTPLTEPELVPQAVTDAFGLRAQPAGRSLVDCLVDHLRDQALLLVLDNCEHLVDACAHLVEALLPACPGLRVLATSRETLRVPGETVHTLQPLATPDPEAVPAYNELLRYDSVRLFVERARDAGGQIGTDGATAQGLAAICAQLDGLPLALELAAARTAALPVPRIAEQLKDCFPALCSGSRTARPQHRALRTAIQWSYDLLDRDERALFRRLAVFVGGFDLPGVEVLWPRPDAVELLGRLVDKSLVVRERGNARYRLLDTIHRFAAEQFADDEKCADVRQRHAEFHLALAEQAQEHLDGADAVEWLDRLAAEHENFRAGMAWAVARPDSTLALRLSSALTHYCQLRGHYRDGRRWLAAALDRGAHAPVTLRGNALYGSAALTFLQCDYDAAVPPAKQAMAVYESLNDLEGMARTRSLLGSICREQADYPRALEFHRCALDTFREAGDARGIAEALQLCAFSAWLQGDFDPAQQWAQEGLHRMRHLGDAEGAAGALLHLGAIAHYRGDQAMALRLLSEARQTSERTGCQEGIAWALNLLGLVHHATDSAGATALLQESLAVHRKLGDRWRMASVLEALASIACDERRWEHATLLLDEAAALRAAINSPVPPCERPSHERTRATLAAAEQIDASPPLARTSNSSGAGIRARRGVVEPGGAVRRGRTTGSRAAL